MSYIVLASSVDSWFVLRTGRGESGGKSGVGQPLALVVFISNNDLDAVHPRLPHPSVKPTARCCQSVVNSETGQKELLDQLHNKYPDSVEGACLPRDDLIPNFFLTVHTTTRSARSTLW